VISLVHHVKFMTDDFNNEIPLRPPVSRFQLLLLVALAGLGFAWFLNALQPRPRLPHPSVGKPAPAIVVDGWLNGQGPTSDELAGQMYMVDAFAYWCRPCLAAAPHTVDLYKAYKDRGVLFLGLTTDDATVLDDTKTFLKKANFPWPCGYGASNTLVHFYQSDSTPIPAAWVVNRQGVIVWAGHPLDLNTEIMDELVKQ